MSKATAAQIKKKYEELDLRLAQEKNDYLLPQVIDFIVKNKWVNLRPEYQRRLVWDSYKKSRYLESLLLNIPTPPIFLFETELNKYEVMDGQQRLNAIAEFYDGRLALHGLERWSELNGYTYSELPKIIQVNFDRRRISALVLQAEGILRDESKKNLVRREVFERLNTGGMSLNTQEIRNCVYSGNFANMLVEISESINFRQAWDIPYPTKLLHGKKLQAELLKNKLYSRMLDCEIVLRFFALRTKANIKGSVKGILDKCMEQNSKATPTEIKSMVKRFDDVLSLSREIFGSDTFKIEDDGKKELSKPLYDAVMVAVDRQFENRIRLLEEKSKIVTKLNQKIKNEAFYELIVGRANTAESVRQRLDQIEKILINAIQ